jgi:hypothetical protein
MTSWKLDEIYSKYCSLESITLVQNKTLTYPTTVTKLENCVAISDTE